MIYKMISILFQHLNKGLVIL